MKMVMAVVPRDLAENVLGALIEAGYSATCLDSRGGMLRQSQQSLFIAAQTDEVDRILALIRGQAAEPGRVKPLSGGPGGAAIFVWDLDRMETG